jgi:ABC-2 type transport system permease protein
MKLFSSSQPGIRTAALILIILLAAWILSIPRLRFDLTSEKRYTLSDFTKTTLEDLDDIIYIKVYLEGPEMPVNLKTLRNAVQEQLEEYRVYGGDNFEFEFINPSESPKQEQRFAMYEKLAKAGLFPIEAQEVSEQGRSSQKMVFPGAIVSYKGRELGVNLLSATSGVAPESEINVNHSMEELEYRLTNALQKVTRKEKPQIAFTEGHGELSEYAVMDMSRVLSEYYEVKRGSIGGQPGILDDFKAIIIAKPQKEFSEQDKYVIDQYIMSGGNVLWLTEGAVTNLDSLFESSYTMALGNETGLDDMLFNYGLRINADLIMDKQSAPIGIRVMGADGEPRIEMFPWYYFPVISSDNNHPISKNLDYIRTEFVSSIDTLSTQEGIQKTVLLSTSRYSQTEQVPVRIELAQANRMPPDAYLTAGKQAIAVLLEGRFESVFKLRSPQSFFPNKNIPEPKYQGEHSKMIVVSDGDIIKNHISSDNRPYPVGFDVFTKEHFEGNQQFILNAVNYLCEDGGLMSIRSRELKIRLLDTEKIQNHRLLIQILNIGIPILIILIFGFIINFVRRRKYK